MKAATLDDSVGIYHLSPWKSTMFWVLLTSFLPLTAALQWTDSPTNHTKINSCSNSDIYLPGNVTLSPGEEIVAVTWTYLAENGSEDVMAIYIAGYFSPMNTHNGSVKWTGQAGIAISQAAGPRSRNYSVVVRSTVDSQSFATYSRTFTVQMTDPPTAKNGELKVHRESEAVYDNTTGEWRVQLTCGVLTDLGHPAVNAIWTTPEGHTMESSSQDNGTFRLLLPNSPSGGNYTCTLPPLSPATRCLPPLSPLLEGASVNVDEVKARFTLLEARQRETEAGQRKIQTQLEAKVKQLEAKNEQQEAKNEKQEAKIKQHEAKIKQQETKINQQETKINQQKARNDQQETKINQQKAKNEQQEAKIKQQETKINQQKAKNEQQEAKIKQQETKINQQKARNDQQETKINQQETKINQQETKINQSEARNDEQETKINQQEAKIDQLEAKIDQQDQGLMQVESELEKNKSATLPLLKNCADARSNNRKSGVVTVYPDNNTPLEVYCDQDTDGGGWLVFQRRQDSRVDFFRDWASYQKGFGDVSKSFWLGLDALHMLTSRQRCELRVDLMKFDGTKGNATYSNFSISDSSDKYRLSYDNFTGGNAGDSLRKRHKNQQFSTYDADHDSTELNCANRWHGAWWYKDCHDANLNGRYKTSRMHYPDGVTWYTFDNYDSLKFAEMKLRPQK